MRTKVLICLVLGVVVALVRLVEAGAEKGPKKCSDGIDNDGDGRTDRDDPDCRGDGFTVAVTLIDGAGYSIQSDGLPQPYFGVIP